MRALAPNDTCMDCVQQKEGWADKDALEASRGAVDFERLSQPNIHLRELLDGEDLKAFETRYSRIPHHDLVAQNSFIS